jgi:hypothetical protein
VRHGEAATAAATVAGDPYLGRVNADMGEYLLLEAVFCECDTVCVCGWDHVDGEQTDQDFTGETAPA